MTNHEQRFRLYLHDHALVRRAEVGPSFEGTVVMNFDAPGKWSLALPPDSDAARILGPRSRLVVEDDNGPIFSGPVRSYGQRSQDGVVTILASGPDDTGLLAERLALPTPTLAYQTSTGTAEAVAREKVRLNLGEDAGTRAVAAVITTANAGRGQLETVLSRYETVREAVEAALRRSTLGVRMVLRNASLMLDIYAPQDRSNPAFPHAVVFNQQYHTLGDYEYRISAAETNFLYGLGGGEGAARLIVESWDQSSIDRWGAIIESSRDARDTTDATEIVARLQKDLIERGDKANLDVTLLDTENTRFGEHYGLGDKVAIQLYGLMVTERIMQVQISFSDGSTFVEPALGTIPARSVLELLNARVRQLRRDVRYLERSV